MADPSGVDPTAIGGLIAALATAAGSLVKSTVDKASVKTKIAAVRGEIAAFDAALRAEIEAVREEVRELALARRRSQRSTTGSYRAVALPSQPSDPGLAERTSERTAALAARVTEVERRLAEVESREHRRADVDRELAGAVAEMGGKLDGLRSGRKERGSEG